MNGKSEIPAHPKQQTDSLRHLNEGEVGRKSLHDKKESRSNASHEFPDSLDFEKTLTTRPANETLKDVSFFSSSQKKSVLISATESWKKNVPFLLALAPQNKNTQRHFITDGQKVQRKYLEWGAEKFASGGGENAGKFSDSTVFFVSNSSNQSLIRLGTVSEIETIGLGYIATIDLISINTSEEEKQGRTNEKKVLLHLLYIEKAIHQVEGYEQKSFLAGLHPKEIQEAAQNLLFRAAAAPFNEDRTPLVRMLLRFGVDPKKELPWEESSPWKMAVLRNNHSIQKIMSSFSTEKK